MAGFPAALLDVRVSLALGVDPASDSSEWPWTNITDQVLVRDGIRITRGRPDEASETNPTAVALTLKNTDGQLSPRNPNGPYFGQLRKNTPLRVEVIRGRDAFGRTAVDSWGSADSGQAWTIGAGPASNYSVSSNKGRHNITTTNLVRQSRLATALADVDVIGTFSTSALAAGAPIEVGFALRRNAAGTDYVWCIARLNTDATIAPRIFVVKDGSGGVYTGGTGPTHVANTDYWIRAQMVDQTIRLKIWLASDPEPTAWNLSAEDDQVTAAGEVSWMTFVFTGGTVPLEVRLDDVEVACTRAVAFISEFPPRWHVSGADSHMPITASGITRRLGQGQAPLRSTLVRAGTSQSDVQAYWPMEDGEDSTSFAAAVGTSPLRVTGSVSPGSSTEPGLDGSAPLAVMAADTVLSGVVPAHSATAWQVEVIHFLPAAPTTDVHLLTWRTAGTVVSWGIFIDAADPDSVQLRGLASNGTTVVSDFFTFTDNYGEWLLFNVRAEQNGADIDYGFEFTQVSLNGAGAVGSVVGTVGAVQSVALPSNAAMVGTSTGHIKVRSEAVGAIDTGVYMGGRPGLAATARWNNLCDEEGIDNRFVGTESEVHSAAMGPQPRATLLALLRECEAADSGAIMFEDRWRSGYKFLQHYRRYNRGVALELDYAAEQVAPPLEPTDDDQRVHNDVTVTRRNGSSAQVVDTAGPLGVDSIGRYDESVTLNLFTDDVLEQHAAWRMHLGTVDEMRYPAVSLNFAAAPELIDEWLDVDIGDRLTVDNLPSDVPDVLADLIVEGYTELLTPVSWFATANCSPASPWDAWVIEATGNGGRLETAGSQLASSATSSATSLSVATTSGPIWYTAGDDFDVDIGGERMTVTAVSGASSPQTFTVVRSVNGVVKPHDAATPVRLWKPAVLALL